MSEGKLGQGMVEINKLLLLVLPSFPNADFLGLADVDSNFDLLAWPIHLPERDQPLAVRVHLFVVLQDRLG